MNLQKVKIEPAEETWKDWFIIDEPKKKVKVSLLGSDTRELFIDARFKKFRISGITKDKVDAQFMMYYIFHEGNPLKLNQVSVISRIIDSKTKLVEFYIERE